MKTLHKIKIAAALLFLGLIMVSCVPKQETLGDAGLTTVKLVKTSSDGYFMYAIGAISTSQKFLVLDVRKSAANSADLNVQTVVTLQLDGADTAMLKAYNKTYKTNYVPLPTSTYVFDPAIASGKITLTYAPGDFAKQIYVTIPNALLLDMSKAYGFCFKASTTGVGTWSGSTNDTMLIHVMPKNKYDGLYLLKGVHNRSPYNLPYETNMELRTTGASSVAFWWPDAEDYGHPIGTADGISWYGNVIAPVIVFDPVTDFVSNVYNAGGPTVITKFTGAGANSNLYDAATKTIYVSWNYNGNPLRAFFDTLTFVSDR
jgi:hypothetical protein